jgi:hypothetical protein
MPTCVKCGTWADEYTSICPNPECRHEFSVWKIRPEINYDTTTKINIDIEDEDVPNRRTGGAVYLIGFDNNYKIGKTKNYTERINFIKLQMPGPLVEVHKIKTNDITALETHWHKRFKSKRRNGEWFKLTDVEVSEFTAIKEIIYE